ESLPVWSSSTLIISNPPTHLYAWAIAIQAASRKENFDCILVPSEIANMAAKKRGKAVKVRNAVTEDNIERLTVKQLQNLAQANSISITCTKKDFIRLLNPLEPDIDLESLKGGQLKSLIKKHRIGALRSNDEFIRLIKQKLSNDG
ncbi:MAG: hypothetical protein HN590_15465, partial [Calditrichaeota bacterium]|nr:hypothetical protein [Calditrichota bacterium]